MGGHDEDRLKRRAPRGNHRTAGLAARRLCPRSRRRPDVYRGRHAPAITSAILVAGLRIVRVEKSKTDGSARVLLDAVFSEQALPISQSWRSRWATTIWMSDDDARNQTVYPLWRQVLDLRVSTLHDLLSPLRLRRMVDGEQVFGRDAVLTVGELLGKLSQSCLPKFCQGTPSGLSPMRRELQLQYIESLGNLCSSTHQRVDMRDVSALSASGTARQARCTAQQTRQLRCRYAWRTLAEH